MCVHCERGAAIARPVIEKLYRQFEGKELPDAITALEIIIGALGLTWVSAFNVADLDHASPDKLAAFDYFRQQALAEVEKLRVIVASHAPDVALATFNAVAVEKGEREGRDITAVGLERTEVLPTPGNLTKGES